MTRTQVPLAPGSATIQEEYVGQKLELLGKFQELFLYFLYNACAGNTIQEHSKSKKIVIFPSTLSESAEKEGIRTHEVSGCRRRFFFSSK